ATLGPFGVVGAAQPAPVGPTLRVPATDRRVSLRVQGASLRDTLALVERLSGRQIHPLWIDPGHTEGLDPEKLIDLDCRVQLPMRVLEAILSQADITATWQPDGDDGLEVGPRSRLNEHRRVEVYAVHDLITALPD